MPGISVYITDRNGAWRQVGFSVPHNQLNGLSKSASRELAKDKKASKVYLKTEGSHIQSAQTICQWMATFDFDSPEGLQLHHISSNPSISDVIIFFGTMIEMDISRKHGGKEIRAHLDSLIAADQLTTDDRIALIDWASDEEGLINNMVSKFAEDKVFGRLPEQDVKAIGTKLVRYGFGNGLRSSETYHTAAKKRQEKASEAAEEQAKQADKAAAEAYNQLFEVKFPALGTK